MLGQGTHAKPAGTITDDTELALSIAGSLDEQNEFDPADTAERFMAWYDSNPFDAGLMTVDAIQRLEQGADWDEAGHAVWETRPEGQNAGNGSVMRCAPYAIAFADNPAHLDEISRTSSAITHADPRCTAGCAILNRTLAGLLTDENHPLRTALGAIEADAPKELVNALSAVPDGIDFDTLQSSGYVVHTLQTALYIGLTADSPREGIVNAVNMGSDTDTVGAVTGAIVGARFGASELPESWVQQLTIDEERRDISGWCPETRPTNELLRSLAESLSQ